MWRAKLVALGLWAGAIAALIASIVFIFAVTSYAAPVVTVAEPSPRDAYEQRWVKAVHYCADKVRVITQRPVIYQVGVVGSVPRYTTDRQEHLYQLCVETVMGLP